jgi:hypothetical protein
MNVLPTTGTAWGRLLLLPFKVYAATAWLGASFYVTAAGRQFDTSVIALVILGYLLSVVALLLGGIVQRACGNKEDSTISFFAAGSAVFFCWVLIPRLAA